jgi:hypothetical protein
LNSENLDNLKKRLFLDVDKAKAEENFKKMMNKNYNRWSGYFIDKYHDLEIQDFKVHKLHRYSSGFFLNKIGTTVFK